MASGNTNNVYRVGDVPGVGRMFPRLPTGVVGCPYDVKITHEGIYSITDPRVMTILIREIGRCRALTGASIGVIGTLNADLSKLTITDATANCGGSVLGFAETFNHVNAVEIDTPTFDILKHNVVIYGYKNITLINADYTAIMGDLKQDVIFVDPPWGGRGYDLKTGIRLTLGTLSMREVAIRGLDGARLVVLKLPLNYDFSEFSDIKGVKYYQKNVNRIAFIFLIKA